LRKDSEGGSSLFDPQVDLDHKDVQTEYESAIGNLEHPYCWKQLVDVDDFLLPWMTRNRNLQESRTRFVGGYGTRKVKVAVKARLGALDQAAVVAVAAAVAAVVAH
jgi:hypothetical protein